VPGVAARSNGCDIHSFVPHVLDGPVHQAATDPAPLVRRIDGDHVDDTHSILESVSATVANPTG
jgi:hypothetical protein